MLKINTQEADTIFYGGKVHSVNAKDEIFEAIAIKDNRVLALGTVVRSKHSQQRTQR